MHLPKLNSPTHPYSIKLKFQKKNLSCKEDEMRRNLKNDISLRFLSVFRLYRLGKKGKEIFCVHLRGERNGCSTIHWWIYIQRSPSTNARRKIKKNEFSQFFWKSFGDSFPFSFLWFHFFRVFFCVIKKFIPSNMHRMQLHIHIQKKYFMGKFEIRKRRFLLVRSASSQFPSVQ